MSNKEELENAGAVMLGVAYTDLTDSSVVLSIEEAGGVLFEDTWPMAEWPFTNDAEGYLRDTTMAFPHMFVINLVTMEVHSATAGDFVSNGYDYAQDLIDTISAF